MWLWMWLLRLRLRPVVVAAIIQGARDGSTHSQAVASFGAIFALKSLTVHVKFLVFLYIIAVAAAFPCFPCKYVNVACKFWAQTEAAAAPSASSTAATFAVFPRSCD